MRRWKADPCASASEGAKNLGFVGPSGWNKEGSNEALRLRLADSLFGAVTKQRSIKAGFVDSWPTEPFFLRFSDGQTDECLVVSPDSLKNLL